MSFWTDPIQYDDATTQLHKAQENLRKLVENEIDRRTKNNCVVLHRKVSLLLEERAAVIRCLEGAPFAEGARDALNLLYSHNALWNLPHEKTPD